MRKTRLVIIGLAALFLTVSSVFAQEQCVTKPDAAKAKEGIFKELNLTPEQHQKLETNRKAHREKAMQLRTSMMEKEKQLQQAMKDPGVTRAKVDPLVNEIKSLQGQLIDQRVSGIFAVKEILTPEQVTQLHQLMEKRKEGKEDKKGRFQERQNRRKGMETAQD